MALKKQKTIKGYPAEYWRILQLSTNMDRGDAVITLGLYKDKATRDADSMAVIDSFQVDLGSELLSSTGNSDTVKNINLQQAYKILKSKATTESEKEEDRNEGLAWFSDAVDIL